MVLDGVGACGGGPVLRITGVLSLVSNILLGSGCLGWLGVFVADDVAEEVVVIFEVEYFKSIVGEEGLAERMDMTFSVSAS
jgi:hypothetical protein